MMGDEGLRNATEIALLNANYMKKRLEKDFKILYTNKNGMCAHEFIVDCRPFSATSGIEAIDIAKRLHVKYICHPLYFTTLGLLFPQSNNVIPCCQHSYG